jgi:hypothetical protein
VVAQLTALRSLHWSLGPPEPISYSANNRPTLSNSGLLQLTALHSLTSLTLDGWEQRGALITRTDNRDTGTLDETVKLTLDSPKEGSFQNTLLVLCLPDVPVGHQGLHGVLA